MSAGTVEGDPHPHAMRPRLLGYGRSFWLVFWATFALNSSSNLFVLYPLQLVGFGASAEIIGVIIGTWSLASLAARPAVSPLIERFGRRRTAIWALIGVTIALAMYLPINSLGASIYVVRAIHGAIGGTARVALFAMVFDLLPEDREGEAMSVFSTCGIGSAVLAPPLAEWLIHVSGFSAFFIAALAMNALGAVFTWMAPDILRPQSARSTAVAADPAPTYRELMGDARLLPVWIGTLAFALSISSRMSFVAPFATERGVAQIAWYFTVYSLIALIARLGGGWLMDRVGIERILVPAMVVLGVGMALIAGTGHFAMLYQGAILGGLGHAFTYPALSAMVIGRTPDDAIGQSSAIYQSIYDIGAMAGPYALGVIATFFGYGPMFVISGLLAFAGAAYFAASEPMWRARRLA